MVEIALQGESKGILYEGYSKAFKQCIFEEGNVEGRNERYEFRCDYDLECCGRSCCIPEEATIPLWLIIIFIILLLILLAAALLTLAYICAKRRKPKPKKDGNAFDSTRNGYTALSTEKTGTGGRGGLNGYGNGGAGSDRAILVHEQDAYSTPDNLYGGYGNRMYSGYGSGRGGGAYGGRGGPGGYGGRYGERDAYDSRAVAVPVQTRRDSRATMSSDGGGSVVRHGVHETVEESFKQEITYERPASTDSREML